MPADLSVSTPRPSFPDAARVLMIAKWWMEYMQIEDVDKRLEKTIVCIIYETMQSHSPCSDEHLIAALLRHELTSRERGNYLTYHDIARRRAM